MSVDETNSYEWGDGQRFCIHTYKKLYEQRTESFKLYYN